MNSFENLTDLFDEQARINPKAIAVHTKQRSITYAELNFIIWKISTFLHKNGIRPSHIVSLTILNEFTLLVTMLAVARIGATVFVLPSNTPSLLSIEMLKKVKAKIQLIDKPDINSSFLPILNIDLMTLTKDTTPINSNARNASLQNFWIMVSGSGSTGKSKMIPITHKQQIARFSSKNDWFPVSTDDCFASLMHLNHYTTVARYLATFYLGGSIVIFDRSISPVDLFKNHKITLLLATVFHVQKIIKTMPVDSKIIMPSLKRLLIIGSSVSHDLRKQIHDSICPDLFVLYGTNECGIVSASQPPNVYQVPGTVGFPSTGVEIEIRKNDKRVLSHGEIGQICVKTPGMIEGYLDDEESTKKAFEDGWFYPGDMGKFTADGQLIHLGRVDNMMIMAGNNIYPAEIEHCITSHPNVEDAVAMPIKVPMCQELPICAVVLKEPEKSTEKELLDFTYQRLAARGPKRIIILDNIERNEQGKLYSQKLVQKIKMKLIS